MIFMYGVLTFLLIMCFSFVFLSLSSSTSQLQTSGDENRTREPIDYFSKYFGWDAWVEIAYCTNKCSSMPKPITAREVAQFVGIHIAMGTLKVCPPVWFLQRLLGSVN